MDTGYEAIKNLIGILVKKSGYDLDENYSESELKKTRDNIVKVENNPDLDKKVKNEFLSALKIRRSTLENNAESVGKSLLKCYEDKKTYSVVKGKIDYLVNLAKKDEISHDGQTLVSYVYCELRNLENQYEELSLKINNSNYINKEEKDLDVKLRDYLTNSIDNCNNEISLCDEELNRLKDIEHKEELIKSKLDDHVKKIKSDVEAIEKLKKKSLDKSISMEVWEKVEDVEINVNKKLNRVMQTLNKAEASLNEIHQNKNRCNNKKIVLLKEIEKNNKKLTSINERLLADDYIDYTAKVKDINLKELLKININELKNKKDVIYVNVDKVKEELIKEWSKNIDDGGTEIDTFTPKALKIEFTGDKQVDKKENNEVSENDNSFQEIHLDNKEKKEVVVDTNLKENLSNKIELDW